VVCSVCGISRQLVDTDARPGHVQGSISFGPASVPGMGNVSQVQEYRLHIVDRRGRRLGGAVASVQASVAPPNAECCLDTFYTVRVQAALPPFANRFAITPVVNGLELPTGTATDAILDLMSPGGTVRSPKTTTTGRPLPHSSAVLGLLTAESPRRAELLPDAAAHAAIGESIAALAQLPAYAVRVGTVAPSQDTLRRLAAQEVLTLEVFVLVLSGLTVSEVERRLTGMDLAALEAEVAVRLALLSKGFYAVRLISFVLPGPAPAPSAPGALARAQDTEAASGAGAALGLGFAVFFAALLTCLYCLWGFLRRKEAKQQSLQVSPYEIQQPRKPMEPKDPEAYDGETLKGGAGGRGPDPPADPLTPREADLPLALMARPPEAAPPLLPLMAEAPHVVRHPSKPSPLPSPREVGARKPGLLRSGEMPSNEKKSRAKWVEDASPAGHGFSAIVPTQEGQVGASDGELQERAGHQRHGVMGLTMPSEPQMLRPPNSRVAPSPDDVAEPGDASPNGRERRKVPRARDPLAAGDIHTITTVNRGGRSRGYIPSGGH